MADPALDPLGQFRQRREGLADRISRLRDLAIAAGAPAVADRLALSRDQLLADSFRLMVVGEFKRGKSTLINALLGAPVLPAKVAPCTARITELAWGEAPRAWVQGGPSGEDGGAAGWREVPIEGLRELLTLRLEEGDDDLSGSGVAGSGGAIGTGADPVDRVRVEWPLPLLRDGVEIVDSPGLNEHRVRTGIALGYLPRADALLMVLSCEQALSASEIGFLEDHLPGKDLRHAFFLWNRFDAVWDDPTEIEAVQARSRRHLDPRVAPGLDRVFLVAARPALQARQAIRGAGDPGAAAGASAGVDASAAVDPAQAARLERSGVPAFEAALAGFLAHERGPLKLEGPSRQFQRAAEELRRQVLPARRALLEAPLQELRARYLAERPRLDALHGDRARALESLDRRGEAAAAEVSARWAEGARRIGEELPAFVASLDLNALEATFSPRQARRRLSGELETWLAAQTEAWERASLRPTLDAHMQALQADLDRRLSRFLTELRDIEQRICPEVRLSLGEGEELTAAARLIGAVGGALLGPGAAVEGAAHGPSQVARGAGWHLGLGLGLILAGAGAPVVLGASLLLGAGRTVRASLTAAADLREELIGACIAGLEEERVRVDAALRDHLAAAFRRVREALDAALQQHIHEVSRRVEQILAERDRAEADTRAEIERIARLDGQIAEVVGEA